MQQRKIHKPKHELHALQIKQEVSGIQSNEEQKELIYQGLHLIWSSEGLNLNYSYYVEEFYPLPESEIKPDLKLEEIKEIQQAGVFEEVKESPLPTEEGRYKRTPLVSYLRELSNINEKALPQEKQERKERLKAILLALKKYISNCLRMWTRRLKGSEEEIGYLKIKLMKNLALQFPLETHSCLIEVFSSGPPLLWFLYGFLLMIATQGGPLESFRSLASLELDLDQPLELNNLTALHLAARHGYLDLVKALCLSEVTVDQEDMQGWTALCHAFMENKIDVIQDLMSRGSNLNHLDKEGFTLAHIAAHANSPDLIKLLANHGISVSEYNNDGISPLCFAAFTGHAEVIAALADLNVNLNEKDAYGTTPLHLAVRGGHLDSVFTLCERGALVAIPDKQGVFAAALVDKLEDESKKTAIRAILNEACLRQQRKARLKGTSESPKVKARFFPSQTPSEQASKTDSSALIETKQNSYSK